MLAFHLHRSGDEGYFSVPSQNLTFRLVYYDALPQQGISGPVIHIQVYRGAQTIPIREALLRDEVTWTVDRVTYRLRRGYDAILQVAFVPGAPLTIAGLLLMFVAGLMMLLSSPGDLRIIVSEERGEILVQFYGGANQPGPEARRWLERERQQLEGALSQQAELGQPPIGSGYAR